MMVVQINQEECIGCGACIDECRPGAISLVDNKATIDPHRCRQCQVCVSACPAGAIEVVEQTPAQTVSTSPATGEHTSVGTEVVPAKAEHITQQLLPATSGQAESVSKQTVSYEAIPTSSSSKEQQNSLLQRLSLSFVMAIEQLACPSRRSFAAEMGERRRRRWGRGYGGGRGHGNGNGRGRRNGGGRHERRRGEL